VISLIVRSFRREFIPPSLFMR